MQKKYSVLPKIIAILKHSLSVLFITLIAVSGACTQSNQAKEIDWLIEVLELKEGSIVADIGAGDGDQTLAIARHVGSEGQVYSTELGSESLETLRNNIESAEMDNITVIEGHPSQTNLPEESCDAIFMRRVYHHFDDPPAMNESLWQSLKPGGRIAVIDFEPRGSESDSPEGRDTGNQHGVLANTVEEELKQVGFLLVSSEKWSGRNFYIVMEKPETD